MATDEDAEVRCDLLAVALIVEIFPVISMSKADNVKLVRVVFVEKCDWYAHYSVVVHGYVFDFGDFNGVVVIVLGVQCGVVFAVEDLFFVAAFVVQVGEPGDVAKRALFLSG